MRGPPGFDVLANAVHGAMSLPPPTWGSCTGPAEQDSHSDPGTQSGSGCHAWLNSKQMKEKEVKFYILTDNMIVVLAIEGC